MKTKNLSSTQYVHEAVPAFIFLGLLSIAYLAFEQGTEGPFLFDTLANLPNLAQISGEINRETLGSYLSKSTGVIGRPLSAIAFLINDYSWPTAPHDFKQTNLLLHLATGVSLFYLTFLIYSNYSNNRVVASWTALLVGAMWTIHPMHLSTIMHVVQRMSILSNLLIVTGLIVYILFLTSNRLSQTTRIVFASASLVIFGFLASLAKENGFLIFPYALVLHLTFFRDTISHFSTCNRRCLTLIPLSFTILIVITLLYYVSDPVSAYAAREFTLLERLLTQFRVLFLYAYDILLPKFSVTLFRDDLQISRNLLEPITTIISVIALLLLAVFSFLLRRRIAIFAFAILWYLSGHLIESTVIPLEMYFDHRNYLAMYGILFGIGAGTVSAVPRLKIAATFGLAIWIVLALMITWAASKHWSDSYQLSKAFVQFRPESPRSHQFLISASMSNGDFLNSGTFINRAKTKFPANPSFDFLDYINKCILGIASEQDARVLQRVASTMQYERSSMDHQALLRTYSRLDICPESLTPESYRNLLLSMLENESLMARNRTRAYLHNQLATFLLGQGDVKAAIHHFEEAFDFGQQPHDLINIANIYIKNGQECEALETLSKLRQIALPIHQQLYFPMRMRLQPALQKITMHPDDCISGPIDR